VTQRYRVAIDPGSGDRGPEKDLSLDIAQRLDRLCSASGGRSDRGAAVGGVVSVIVRGKPEQQPDAITKHHNASLVISIDSSWRGKKSHGPLAFYHPSNRLGRTIADAIITAWPQHLISRSSKSFPSDEARFNGRPHEVVSSFTATTVLIDFANVESDRDREELARPYTRDLIAAALYLGILRGAQAATPRRTTT
jgi:N-acetylmuramoyl-L-alanine amidase